MILSTLCLACLSLYCIKSRKINNYFYRLFFNDVIRKNGIKDMFNEAALNYTSENLHHGSSWRYLSAEQFKEMILDGVSKMEPQIYKNAKIFELGVGVGAALKVITNHVGDQLEIGGSDIAENAIHQVKKIFPKQADHFFVEDMTKKHKSIPNNYYDHVVSFGALGMYLTKDQMKEAIKEAVRMTKPKGSLLITSLIAPGGKKIGSIVSAVETTFFKENAKEWGIENIKIYGMKHQGDRYQVTFQKKSLPSS